MMEKRASEDERVVENVHHGNHTEGTFWDNRQTASAAFENPLASRSRHELMKDVEAFCHKYELCDFLDDFKKGALVAQNPENLQLMEGLTTEERKILAKEQTHRWAQPFTLYWLCVMCSLAAAVQGMDETAINGAQDLFLKQLRIAGAGATHFSPQMQDYLTGLIVGAPYLCCALLGSWITEPLNRLLGRRGTIFISCVIAAATAIWQGVANSWVNLLIARFVLGFAIGPKSATVPVYAAECAPAPIRGALVMQWQMWTAFGVMLGNIMGVAFSPANGISEDLAWRLMLGSTVVLPLIVCAQVFFCPESPRWYIQKGQVSKAFRSFQRLRFSNIQATRDTYYTCVGVELEHQANKSKNTFTRFLELFTVPRNRRATLATWVVMFGQQFCGVNIIAYYSTTIFISADYSNTSALLASMGTGILNWVFAVPALFTIDKWGRRSLLLLTFPFLAITLMWTGMSFFIENTTTRVAMVTTGMYLFEVFYSPGEGPVPFTYSAEAFPIHVRDIGMSWATATTWCFNFIISFTWPSLQRTFTPQGAFGWYAAWCVVLWFLILLFVPETKALTLEELDRVFGVSTWRHAAHQIKSAQWHFRTWVLREKLQPLPPLHGRVAKANES